MVGAIPSGEELRASLERNGFVRISNAFTEEDLELYRRAAKAATEAARRGDWPYIRTVPKQFPPWSAEDRVNGVWGVQHLLHPDMPAPQRRVFAQSYFNPTMIAAVTRLLDCAEDDLVMELYNMLVRPERDFALRWHRDDIPPTVSADEELERLKERMMHAQWNLALYRDSSLIVVPGSHRRARTEMERDADPFEDDMPGQTVVKMEAGDILFYDNNILHRGVYSKEVERMTLHGTIGQVGTDKARARNVLQHGLKWAGSCDFSDLPKGTRERAQAMQRRLLEMGSGDDVGFSQSD